jgi:predicted ArsR family transcriptional regulator
MTNSEKRVLALLERRPMVTINEVADDLDWDAKRAALVLQTLQMAGELTSDSVPSERGGPPRKVYRLSSEGVAPMAPPMATRAPRASGFGVSR